MEEILEIINKELRQAEIDYNAYPDCQTSTRLSTLKDIHTKVSRVELPVMQKIAGDKRKFTEEEEKYIWWGVQWAFKPENKNRIFKQKEFFDYVYYEMDV